MLIAFPCVVLELVIVVIYYSFGIFSYLEFNAMFSNSFEMSTVL